MIPATLQSSPVIHRSPANPVLTAADVPYHATLVFNAGVTKYQGRYVMVFRNDYGSTEEGRLDGTNMGLATSADGVKWEVAPEPCFELHDDEILRALRSPADRDGWPLLHVLCGGHPPWRPRRHRRDGRLRAITTS